ncbi:hypothetical protein PY650_31015 [Rhizobium calliandrae]|uniref:Uncharacterized protein n=1 Tax=Rhizobium calliandrae TaxID=1312182 RepID=A0ABT7KMV5_9HYPH|nr:hypothetical protein [Rhizobium calliandrae]MDL2409971.1 hypothetical protein [Rhizobium calliandrae]
MNLPTNLRTASSRNAAERLATKFLAANDNTPPKDRSPVYRGGRPAFNWAAKQDKYGAACLWLIARQRLPDSVVAANDNERSQGGLDTRRNGTARGKQRAKSNLGAHLNLPAVLPRLGDAEPQTARTGNRHTRYELRPQNDVDELSDDFRSFGVCADALAPGAGFIGAESGLGTPKPGKSKGSPLKAEDPSFDQPPPDVDYVIELLMARENVSGIGEAFGARGRYQDRKGAAMLTRAMAWAKEQVAVSSYHANVANRVA